MHTGNISVFSTKRGQGSKKVPSGCPGQVDFPVGQVTFHSHLPNGQGPRQVICQLNCQKSNLRLAQGKQNLRATCPKGKLKFKFSFEPWSGAQQHTLNIGAMFPKGFKTMCKNYSESELKQSNLKCSDPLKFPLSAYLYVTSLQCIDIKG